MPPSTARPLPLYSEVETLDWPSLQRPMSWAYSPAGERKAQLYRSQELGLAAIAGQVVTHASTVHWIMVRSGWVPRLKDLGLATEMWSATDRQTVKQTPPLIWSTSTSDR